MSWPLASAINHTSKVQKLPAIKAERIIRNSCHSLVCTTIEADYQISSCIRHMRTLLHNRRLRWYIVAGYREINLVVHISIIVTVGLQIDINASLVIASHQEGVQESGISVK